MIQGIFEHNLLSIKNALQQAGISVLLGGVYPNNRYNAMHYDLLRETDERMGHWDVPVFHWLEDIEDGRGHFREGYYADAGHPNDEGYRAMYASAKKCIHGKPGCGYSLE